jgi:hypothetical protein
VQRGGAAPPLRPQRLHWFKSRYRGIANLPRHVPIHKVHDPGLSQDAQPQAIPSARWIVDEVQRRQRVAVNYQSEDHQLQEILARELQDDGPHPLEPADADAVAWHLADVTFQVVIGVVERERVSGKPTTKRRAWWRPEDFVAGGRRRHRPEAAARSRGAREASGAARRS